MRRFLKYKWDKNNGVIDAVNGKQVIQIMRCGSGTFRNHCGKLLVAALNTGEDKNGRKEHPVMKSIENLKPGDRLIKIHAGGWIYPEIGDIVTVHSCPEMKIICDEVGKPVYRIDFTAIVENGEGAYLEVQLDSRYFERVK